MPEKLPTEGVPAEWIPVTERMPGPYHGILMAFAEHWRPIAGFYTGKNEWWQHGADDASNSKLHSTPTHWMPIPMTPNNMQGDGGHGPDYG